MNRSHSHARDRACTTAGTDPSAGRGTPARICRCGHMDMAPEWPKNHDTIPVRLKNHQGLEFAGGRPLDTSGANTIAGGYSS